METGSYHATSQEELQAILDAMVEGVLLVDNNGLVRLANRALANQIGLSGDPRGLTIMEALRLREVKDLARRAAGGEQVLGYELSLPGLDDCCLQVNATALRDAAGRVHGVVLVFHDVSPVRELERTRKEFVANVSHELRTPLSMISGYVETLLGGAKDDPAVRTRFLQIIQKHTQRLTFLIEDLLTISRLESGRIVMDFKRVELRPLVDQVFADFKSRATERKVTLQNQIPPLLAGRADPERLRQVFSNLVENAIKYGRVGGHVVVTGRTLEQQVEIQVQDDGPGIPVEAKERIFERFYRVDQSRSPDQGGTGLGLAIVKHIVQSHGGTVWLQSEPGKGATFSFTLPAAPNG